jgi:hypothetical protein
VKSVAFHVILLYVNQLYFYRTVFSSLPSSIRVQSLLRRRFPFRKIPVFTRKNSFRRHPVPAPGAENPLPFREIPRKTFQPADSQQKPKVIAVYLPGEPVSSETGEDLKPVTFRRAPKVFRFFTGIRFR